MAWVKDKQFHELIFVLSDVRSRNMVKEKKETEKMCFVERTENERDRISRDVSPWVIEWRTNKFIE